jgi:signal peptidase I
LASKPKSIWKSEPVKTAAVIVTIIVLVSGFWFGSQAILNTKIFPALAVISGSMCIPYDGACDGWLSINHPFERTLHKGDIIIIQGINPQDLNTNYPNSDIIVFHSPQNPNELIVHRIIGTNNVNGTIYFLTKGDGNGNPWPQTPASGFDRWDIWDTAPQGVPPNMIVGKVVMRVPWIGWISIKMQEGGATNLVIPIIAVLIILLVIVEFILPLLKKKRTPD